MKKYLVILIILIIAISVVVISAKTIYAILDSEGNIVGSTDNNYLSQEQIDQGYTIEILFKTSETTKPSEPQSNYQKQNITKQEIEDENKNSTQVDLTRVFLTELSSKYINRGSSIKVDGTIKNDGQHTIKNARINIECIDELGKTSYVQVASTNPADIMPGGQAYFSAELSNIERIIRYKVYIFDKYLKVEYLKELNAKCEVTNWSSSLSKKGDYVCPEDMGCIYSENDGEFIFLNGTIKNVGDGFMTKTDIHIIGRGFLKRTVGSGAGKPKDFELPPGKTVNFSGILPYGTKVDNFLLEISWINPHGNKTSEQTIELK